ncbi:MAG: hypothetical protein HY537_11710 [Deltaproteobacteria bacterium]|nr:hypothetical protein [Deltaproteobacteria bacterium]
MQTTLWVTLLFGLHSAWVSAAGYWFQKPHNIRPLISQIRPDSVLLKWGVFSTNGHVKPTEDIGNMEAACRNKIPLVAWISHRLSQNEQLLPEAGQRLGTELNQLLAAPCFQGVELDIEPLPEPPPWLAPFLKQLRKVLNAHFKLRLAIPPVSDTKLPGLSWLPTRALAIASECDGLDLMVYDTGLTKAFEYERLVQKSLAFARVFFERYPDKTLLLGLPAYKEKTKLHWPMVENLLTASQALEDSGADKSLICSKQLSIAFYAGWTIDIKDRPLALRIEKWRANACKG